MTSTPSATSTRSADTTAMLHPLLADRWSPRAFDASHEVTAQQLSTLLEAARWAPSANNSQPWRFMVAPRGTAAHDALFRTLGAPNQIWAGAADALILVAAETVDDAGVPRPYAAYDAGQAVHALVTQAHAEGLSVHQMGGFSKPAAAETFGLAQSVLPLVVLAVGRHDPQLSLPEPFASRESAPRTRLPVDELLLAAIPVERRQAA
jgi:nitroreductase